MCRLCREVDSHDRDCPHYKTASHRFLEMSIFELITLVRESRIIDRAAYPSAAVTATLAYIADPLGRWALVWLAAAGVWTWQSIKAWRPRG